MKKSNYTLFVMGLTLILSQGFCDIIRPLPPISVPVPNRPTLPPVIINQDLNNALATVEQFCKNQETNQIPSGVKVLKVPQNYPTIKAAVKEANDGEVIYIANGVYKENVDTTKDMIISNSTFKKLIFIGESRDGVIVESPTANELYGFRIGAGTTVRNLTIKNTLNAILGSSQNIIVSNVKFIKNRNGIILSAGTGYSLSGKTEVQCSLFENNDVSGISIGSTFSNAEFSTLVQYNIIKNNGLFGLGIYSGSNIAYSNAIYGNGTKENGTGIIVDKNTKPITILKNYISNQRNAATINSASNLTLRQNIFSFSQYGVVINNEYSNEDGKIIIARNQIKNIQIVGSNINAKRFVLSNNLFYKTGTSTLFLTGEVYSVYNNTFSDGEFGVRINADKNSSTKLNARFINNILVNYTKTALMFSCDSYNDNDCVKSGVHYRNNLLWNNFNNISNLIPAVTSNLFIDPKLGVDNNNPAYPMPGSPVYNQGFNILDAVDSEDLIGKQRIQGGVTDIGAYEMLPPRPFLTQLR